jgi:hypothetical protein
MKNVFATLLAAGLAAMSLSASAASVFNFTGGLSNLGQDETYTSNGITLTVSSELPANIWRYNPGIGLRSHAFDTPRLDGYQVVEALHFDFDQDGIIEAIAFGDWDDEDNATFAGLSFSGYVGNNSFINSLNELVMDADGFDIGAALGTSTDRNDFRIRSITVSAVPIPAAAWLFGSALLGVLGVRRGP